MLPPFLCRKLFTGQFSRRDEPQSAEETAYLLRYLWRLLMRDHQSTSKMQVRNKQRKIRSTIERSILRINDNTYRFFSDEAVAIGDYQKHGSLLSTFCVLTLFYYCFLMRENAVTPKRLGTQNRGILDHL